ncbi:DUF916 domain-containing protein [Lactococcus petauri]|uniref:DUF916 domain-containing protein n=1 Tax=Lactococcus petauri TaxID=1940789 RepID=UPI00254D72AB|nr:DUF916 domain-containing protein [Lactococcus petauri]
MKKIITLLLLLILNIGGGGVLADDAQASNGSYSVSALPSIHQTEGVESFFDIRWTPSYTENIGILIKNNTDEAQTYNIRVNKARTNKNGIIDYSDSTAELNTSKYQLTRMIQLPKEVTVAAGQSKKIEGSLSFPQESFNGLLMAGIHVSEKKSQESGATVSNTVAYNIPFVVRGDNDVRPKANLLLERTSLEKLSSTQSSLDIHLSNEEATLLKESNFLAEITNKSGKVITTQSSKLDITPETKFIYPIKLPEKINAGDYRVTLKVTHGKDQWKFNKNFTITGEEAKEIHQRAGIKDYSWLIFIISFFGIILIFVVLYLVRKKRNKQIDASNGRSKLKKRSNKIERKVCKKS